MFGLDGIAADGHTLTQYERVGGAATERRCVRETETGTYVRRFLFRER